MLIWLRTILIVFCVGGSKTKNSTVSAINVNFVVRKSVLYKQVDIQISKNQVLQVLYLKHHVYKTS